MSKAIRWIGLAAGIGGVAALMAQRRRHPRNGRVRRVPYDKASTRILILGGGFAGMATASELARHLGHKKSAAIRLVDQGDSLTFWPMVPEVIPGTIQAPHVLHSLREQLTPIGVEFVRAQVTDGDLERRQIRTSAGEMTYDKLVLALGWRTAFFGAPGAAANALTLQSVGDALHIRSQVVDQFEAAAAGARADLRFIVVGGGSSGVEVAAAMADLIEVLLPQYPGVSEHEVRLTIVQAKDDLLPHMEKPLRQAAASRLHKDRINVRTDSSVKSVDDRGVTLATGDRVEAGMVIWAAGVEPSPVVRNLRGLPLDARGRVEVDDCLRAAGLQGVYALGDVAAVQSDGEDVAPTAQAAVQEAVVVARNLLADVAGGSLHAFRYRNLGHLVELGGKFAVSQVMGARFSGLTGHLVWRAVYLYKLGDWRDRLHVVSDWIIHQVLPPDVPRLRLR